MRRVPPTVGAAGSLIVLGLVLFGLVRSEEVGLHWWYLFPAYGAMALGAFVLILYWMGCWRR